MDITTFITLSAIGLVAGVLAGLIGLGGGIIIIPAMVILLDFNQKAAQGTSMASMIPPIGLFAAYNYYKAGYVNMKFAIVIALTFMIGGYFSSKLAIAIPEALIRKIFAILLILIAVKTLLSK